jgi:hypothetical protein
MPARVEEKKDIHGDGNDEVTTRRSTPRRARRLSECDGDAAAGGLDSA